MMANLCKRLVKTCFLVLCVWPCVVLAWSPLPVADDPLLRMPGTQPDQGVVLTGPSVNEPNGCFNCHGENFIAGDGSVLVPGAFWQGSMMAQSARDPIFWAAMTVAAQDSIWALGNPNAADLCERCHFPEGWLGGRSEPTNASAMAGSDFDGVHCDVCHNMYDPFFESAHAGTREPGANWDEATVLSQNEADITLDFDRTEALGIRLFGVAGQPFYVSNQPRYGTYTENGGGQYFVSTTGTHDNKRGPFADTAAFSDHAAPLYSRYHKSKFFCSTCHDVSNPVLANLGASGLADQSGGSHLITEQYPAGQYFHVERTFSEFMLSAYGQDGGAATNPEFQTAATAAGYNIPSVDKCQDCHMPDVIGKGADQLTAPERPTDSTEHPNSGAPEHNLQGGNLWITRVLASLDFDGANYDPVNYALLTKGDPVVAGPAALTMDLTQGMNVVKFPTNVGTETLNSDEKLTNAAQRAETQLQMAATLKDVQYDPANGALSFRIQNNTGHKLISGFPEGRRMFIGVRAFDGGASLVYEVNPYDTLAGTLKGLNYAYSTDPGILPRPLALAASEERVDPLVYEVHPKSELTGEDESFHFVLATGRYKDNRIPPKGFDIAAAPTRVSEPVWHGASAPEYFTAGEYAGGYDEVNLVIPPGAASVDVTLYYQGTSREYIEFLRDEINGSGTTTLPSPGAGGDAAYLAQSDPFFAGLAAWGDTIWDLWFHNHGLDGVGTPIPGIVPFVMTAATATPAALVPMTLLTPNGGESLSSGDTYDITWSGPLNAASVLLEYSLDNGSSWITIATVSDVTGYTWTIPPVAMDETDCLVRATARDGADLVIAQDVSDAVFTLVKTLNITSPNGGEYVHIDDNVTLTWDSPANATSYDLDYSLDNGQTWTAIASVGAVNSYDWQTPALTADAPQSLIRVTAYDDALQPAGQDVSDATFTILVANLVVIWPNGGEAIPAGTVQNILWSAHSSVQHIQVQARQGRGWTTIDTDAVGGSSVWNVPAQKKTYKNALVRLRSLDDRGRKTKLKDQSDSKFSIATFRVTSPTGGEMLTGGTPLTVTWDTFATTAPVTGYQLHYQEGRRWKSLGKFDGNPGSHELTLPDVAATTQMNVRVTLKAGNRSLGKETNAAPFTVNPGVTMN